MRREKVAVSGHNVMTYTIGEGDNVLLLLHGGPGCPCNYLRDSHSVFAEHGYKVVTWDQLGCGESDTPNNETLWTIERFVKEVETVRKTLNLGEVHLLGQSWGGVLGLEYCFEYTSNVKTFIAANTAFDLSIMQRGFERYKMALGEETFAMMSMREADGTTQHPEYQAAITLLMYRHICRNETWPDSVKFSMENIAEDVFGTIFGKYFFNCTGNIRDYNRMDELHKLNIPVLLVHGKYDEITPELACIARDRLKNAELVLFRNSSHMPFIEETEKYVNTVCNFLKKTTKVVN